MVFFLQIGEVVDGPDDTDRPIFEGIQYDYGKFQFLSLAQWLRFTFFTQIS